MDNLIARVATALKEAMKHPHRITHFGAGACKVDRIASNRRFIKPNAEVSYSRMSRMKEGEATAAEEGTIDPWLRTLSFWDGEHCICALHSYAVHRVGSPTGFESELPYAVGVVKLDDGVQLLGRLWADDDGDFGGYHCDSRVEFFGASAEEVQGRPVAWFRRAT